jgi:hypothetical protein
VPLETRGLVAEYDEAWRPHDVGTDQDDSTNWRILSDLLNLPPELRFILLNPRWVVDLVPAGSSIPKDF